MFRAFRTATRSAAILLAGTLISVWPPAAVVRAQTEAPTGVQGYPLLCRAGEGLELSLVLHPSDPSRQSQLRPESRLTFRPNAREAGQRGEQLAPGTCAWADRALRPDESREVRWTDSHFTATVQLRFLEAVAAGVSLIGVMPTGRSTPWFAGAAGELPSTRQICDVWPCTLGLSPTVSGTSTSTSRTPQPSPPGRAASTEAGAAMQFRRGPRNAFQIRMGNGEWRDAGGELTSDPASAAMPSGQTFVAGRGQDSAIWVTTCAQAQCNGWTSIGGVLTSAPSVRVSSDGTVHITGTGQDGNAWTNVFDAAQQKWSGWAAVASQEKAR